MRCLWIKLRQAYDRPATWIVSCKSNLQLAYDYRVGRKSCRRLVVRFLYATKSYRVNRPFRELSSKPLKNTLNVWHTRTSRFFPGFLRLWLACLAQSEAVSVIAQIPKPMNSYPVPAVTSIGLSSTSDVISFDQNWHHLYSTAAGRKHLSNNTQIRVVGLMEREICTKTLKKLSEKLRANFPPLLDILDVATHGILISFFNCK